MDKLNGLLHLPGRKPVEVEIEIGDVLTIEGPGIRFAIEPVGFSLQNEGAPADVQPVIKAAGLTFADCPADPAEGWPWLYQNCPQLFGDVDIKREPYYHHIEAARQRPNDQFTAGVNLILANPEQYQNGKGKWHQTRIAEAIGTVNAGGGRRLIDKAIKMIEQRLREAA